MNTFQINTSPLMTSYLVKEVKAFRDRPVVILDIGARGGIGKEWAAFEDQLRVYAFEADARECERLSATAPPGLSYIPRAIGKSRGNAILYETDPALSSGLYRTRMDYFGRMLNRDNGTVVGERIIEVVPLDEVLPEYGVSAVDFIKLDAEGAELDILQGARRFLRDGKPLGILSELRFHEEINGSPPFAALDDFARGQGFRLFDLQFYHQSRAALPYPPAGDYRKPTGERYHAYTTRGQLQDGDALYFRDLLLPSADPTCRRAETIDILKLCAFLEIFSLNDCAAELLLACRAQVDAIAGSERLLDLLASGTAGQAVGYAAYMKQYFEEPLQRDRPGFFRRLLKGQ
ncbi:MAG TPA: FkbM family methyltransferase [Reyranella sp.]|nr:FkbM family methyltransferase [Reyranella sp.]